MKKVVAAACLVCIAAACGNGGSGKIILKAHVFERKMLPGNKLQVSYIYQKGQALINDSAIVDNKIIPQDSVPVNLLVKNTGANAGNP
ncbi:MAG TPA: hypothetical protein VG738_00330 [Chitinophagaceae bacterium]|nr:hypothetical protein [Chitinophagaceae bacterium]